MYKPYPDLSSRSSSIILQSVILLALQQKKERGDAHYLRHYSVDGHTPP
jgi:hypothetical protein